MDPSLTFDTIIWVNSQHDHVCSELSVALHCPHDKVFRMSIQQKLQYGPPKFLEFLTGHVYKLLFWLQYVLSLSETGTRCSLQASRHKETHSPQSLSLFYFSKFYLNYYYPAQIHSLWQICLDHEKLNSAVWYFSPKWLCVLRPLT